MEVILPEFETKEQALEAIEKAIQMLSDICSRKKEWVLHIPARFESDPDLVIGKGLRAGRWLAVFLNDLENSGK